MAALTLALIHSAAVVAVDVPVIGIISRENLIPNHENDGGYYVGASYIKWLESAGARSIAILANATDEEVDMIVPQINGLLMPGGRKSDTKAETRLYKLAKEANESGETFPIMGICWGFQRLPIIQHGPNHHDEFKEQLIRDPFDSEDLSLPLEFTPYGATQSAIFDPEMQELLSKPISYHHHEAGMVPDVFAADPAVSEMFEITSLNHDRGGKVFVSSMEARDFDTYPFWGFQWHPEKAPYEYGTLDGTDDPINPHLSHSSDATLMSFKMADKFVELARKSTHVYTEYERWPLVWEYPMFRSDYFEQFFIVDELAARSKHSDHELAAKSKLRGGGEGVNDDKVASSI